MQTLRRPTRRFPTHPSIVGPINQCADPHACSPPRGGAAGSSTTPRQESSSKSRRRFQRFHTAPPPSITLGGCGRRKTSLFLSFTHPFASTTLAAISQAFACLSNPDKRRTYDQLGFDPDHRQYLSAPPPFFVSRLSLLSLLKKKRRQIQPIRASGSGMRFRRHAYGAQFAFDGEEISPEEIFNMFFGVPPSNMPGRGRANVYRFYQRTPAYSSYRDVH